MLKKHKYTEYIIIVYIYFAINMYVLNVHINTKL